MYDEVGAQALGVQSSSGRRRSRRARTAARNRAPCASSREALLGRGVAVDADQRAGRAQALGDQPRVATAAEGAVDSGLAGTGIEEVDQLRGEDWNVLGGHVGQCGHLATPRPQRSSARRRRRPAPRRSRRPSRRSPRRGRPSARCSRSRGGRRRRSRRMGPRSSAGVVDQVLRDANPPGGVERLVVRAAVEAPSHHPPLAAERVELGEDLLLESRVVGRSDRPRRRGRDRRREPLHRRARLGSGPGP